MALFVLSLPLVTPRIYASDEIEYFAYLRSIWFDRDLSFENEYRYFYDRGIAKSPGFYETFLERQSPTGRRLNFAPMGCAILWAPFYAVGDLAARALNALGYPVAVDGYSAPYVRAVCYGSAVYGFVAVLLSLAAVSRAMRRPLTTSDYTAALAVWWGTPLFFYMYVAPPMSHATSAFAVSAFVLAWLRVREHWDVRGFVLLGVLAGLMTSVREQDAFFAVGPAIDLALASRRLRVRQVVTGLVSGAVCFALVYVPQAIAYLRLNGRLGPSEIVSRKMYWYSPHALEVLASPEHGLLFWTPLAALAIAGLAFAARTAGPVVAGCLAAMAAAQVYIAGAVDSWTVAGAFGQRRFVGLTCVLVIGLAALFERTVPSYVARPFRVARLGEANRLRQGYGESAEALRAKAEASQHVRRSRRAVVLSLTAIAVWWNIGLIVQFGSGLMDRQRLELGRITYNNFVAVPMRVPELAYRYLFARSSFYRAPAGTPDPGR